MIIKTREQLFKVLDQFDTEPIDKLASDQMLGDHRISQREAMNIDLTNYVILDMAYRYRNAGDVAVNIRGSPNKGKSNILLWYGMQWCSITGQPYEIGNIAFNPVEYNMLLKGYRVVESGVNEVTVTNFEMQPGIHLSMDEASDVNRTGPLAMTTIMQTTDLEKRMRALQVGRFCAGVSEILHQAYYNIYAIKRNPKEKICTGIVYVKHYDNSKVESIYLGRVDIPYVDISLFKAYNKPKIKSIKDYGRGFTATKVAQIMEFFVRELKEDDEYQMLPNSPSIRVNWLQRNPKYSVWTTTRYFEELEKMTRPGKLLSSSSPAP